MASLIEVHCVQIKAQLGLICYLHTLDALPNFPIDILIIIIGKLSEDRTAVYTVLSLRLPRCEDEF
jgi:hypothetical protein